MFKLDTPQPSDYPTLLAIWESSIKATHHFLKPGDVEFFKKTIQEKKLFYLVSLTIARDENNEIRGFIGVSDDAVEMLFLDPGSMGKGVGKQLLRYVIDELRITKVDVNEQNEQALKFYQHFGFNITSRSELDGTGKPYPILHLQYQQ